MKFQKGDVVYNPHKRIYGIVQGEQQDRSFGDMVLVQDQSKPHGWCYWWWVESITLVFFSDDP